MSTDTIFAIATGPGLGAVQICRISGSSAAACVVRLTGRPLPRRRSAVLRFLHDPVTGARIDQGLVLWFGAPSSYTGEDCAELQMHGGLAVRRALSDALVRCGPDIRPAEPGEFTERAFRNGRMDLTQAEAVQDLIAAQSSAQRLQALRQLDGHVGTLCRDWTYRLTVILAGLEAGIDFADESETQGADVAAMVQMRSLREELKVALGDGRLGEQVRNGFRVVLVGAPNAGKSTLLNQLAGREAAIVSAIPGTTRDVVEVQIEIAGQLVSVCDTAGLRHSDDPVEAEGVRRALEAVERADLAVAVVDMAAWPLIDPMLEMAIAERDERWIKVLSKSDLCCLSSPPWGWLAASAVTPGGLERLIKAIESGLAQSASAGTALLTRARHLAAVRAMVEALGRAEGARDAAVCAEEVRLALREAGRLTGLVDPEQVLDMVFRSFCLGK